MIKFFANNEIEDEWNREFFSKLPNEIQKIARRKLRILNNSQTINDLSIPPANRLEKLKVNIKGFHSIRGNRQRRITVDTASRLSKYFGSPIIFWLGLQNDYSIEEELKSMGEELENIPTMN